MADIILRSRGRVAAKPPGALQPRAGKTLRGAKRITWPTSGQIEAFGSTPQKRPGVMCNIMKLKQGLRHTYPERRERMMMYASGMGEFVDRHGGSSVIAGRDRDSALDRQWFFVMTEASR